MEENETQIKQLEEKEIVNELALLSYGKIDENSINFAKYVGTK